MHSNPSPAGAQVGPLFVAHGGWLTSLLRKKLGCAHKAEDFAQDTFLKVLASHATAAIQEPRAFLRTIAHGLVVSHWRRADLERAYLERLGAGPQDVAPSAEEHALAIEHLAQVESLLAALPPKARRAFVMSQVEGCTYAEVASELGVSDRMVKKYMAQAMQHLLLLDA